MDLRKTVEPRVARWVLAIGIVGLLLAGCNKKPAETVAATDKPTGQVIAHVGKQDITAQELENEFRWNAIPPDKRDDAVTKRILTELVLRKYLAQRAIDAGLDRDPVVLLDLLRGRDLILAQVFIGRDVSTKVAAIGKSQIDALIASQPWRFGDRQVLTVEQISVPPTAQAATAVEATKDLKSLDEIEQKLNELKVLHSRSMGLLNSAQLNEQLFKTILEKKDTDQFFIRTPQGGVFFKVKDIQPAPLAGEAADKAARELLVADIVRGETQTKGLAVAVDSEVKYEGNYAKIMGKEEQPKPADGK